MSYIKHGTPEENAKHVIALFIVLITFAVFYLFYINQDYILNSGNFYLFLTLATVCSGFMLWLLYIVNNQKPQHHTRKAIAKPASKKKKNSR